MSLLLSIILLFLLKFTIGFELDLFDEISAYNTVQFKWILNNKSNNLLSKNIIIKNEINWNQINDNNKINIIG